MLLQTPATVRKISALTRARALSFTVEAMERQRSHRRRRWRRAADIVLSLAAVRAEALVLTVILAAQAMGRVRAAAAQAGEVLDSILIRAQKLASTFSSVTVAQAVLSPAAVVEAAVLLAGILAIVTNELDCDTFQQNRLTANGGGGGAGAGSGDSGGSGAQGPILVFARKTNGFKVGSTIQGSPAYLVEVGGVTGAHTYTLHTDFTVSFDHLTQP
jgi:uncharacterized membrane protein YgcG